MYSHTVGSGSPTVLVTILNGWMTITASGANGSRTITVTAMDEGGKRISDTFTVTKTTPVCTITVKGTGVPNFNVLKGNSLTIDFSKYFDSRNCPDLTYEVTGVSSKGYLSVSPTGVSASSTRAVSGVKRGFDYITVWVRNGSTFTRDVFRVSVIENAL